MVSSLKSARLASALAAIRSDMHDARHDVTLLPLLAARLSRLGAEITDAYERAFVVAIQASAA